MNVLRLDVYVLEEVIPHERVVGLRVITGETNIFIHVEGNNVFKTDFTGLVHFNQNLVNGNG
jgi:hypothetical protein